MKNKSRFITFEVVTSDGDTEHITFRVNTLSEAEAALKKAAKVRGIEFEAVKRLRKVRHAVALR